MRILKSSLAILVGLIIYAAVLQRPLAMAMLSKASGGDQPCPWPQLARYPWAASRFADLQQASDRQLTVEREDPALGIQSLRSVPRAGPSGSRRKARI